MTGDSGRKTKTGETTRILPPSSVPGLRSAPRRVVRSLRAALTLVCALAVFPVASWLPVGAAQAASPPAGTSQTAPTPTPPPADEPPSKEDSLLLPDLLTRPPDDMAVVRAAGGRILRFTNTVWNGGDGPLELNGDPDPGSESIQVSQRAYTTDGVAVDWPVGVFTYHPHHRHWHLDGFVIYELWSVGSQGTLDRLISTSGKLSYCLIDTDQVDRYAPVIPPGAGYFGCGRTRQGLSIGWGDTYRSYLDGQSLPLNRAPDGLYALVSTANANRVLRETKVSNNTGRVYIQISGNRVTVVPRSQVARERCPAAETC